MIRLRNADGKCFTTEKLGTSFVEVCDTTGAVAAVVYSPAKGEVVIAKAGDPEYFRYLELYKLKGVRITPEDKLENNT
jgi:hypothetical protein